MVRRKGNTPLCGAHIAPGKRAAYVDGKTGAEKQQLHDRMLVYYNVVDGVARLLGNGHCVALRYVALEVDYSRPAIESAFRFNADADGRCSHSSKMIPNGFIAVGSFVKCMCMSIGGIVAHGQ